MNDFKQFSTQRAKNILKMSRDKLLRKLALDFIMLSGKSNYSYNFDWLGIPIIQYPQDIVAMQEIVWKVKPDLIIETGIARGGSLIFYASILELIGNGSVVGIDIDIRKHNRDAILKHPLSKRIIMFEGSSVELEIVKKVKQIAKNKKKILICLDSFHTFEHVLKELELYSPMVSLGSYIIVFDTIVEQMPENYFSNRPWGKGNNPSKSVELFLRRNKNFKIDKEIENKLVITVAPSGYLKRVK